MFVALTNRASLFFGVSAQVMAIVFIARLVQDTGVRLVYPFIPQFAAGLGLTTVEFGWLVFLISIGSLTSPLFGLLADWYGRRRVMALGLFSIGTAALWLAFSMGWWAILPFILLGFAFSMFLPSQQAYISDQAAHDKQGRALGAVEMSWATCAILILPVAGWLLDRFNWQAPLFALCFISYLGAVMVWVALPPSELRESAALSRADWQRFLSRINVAMVPVAAFTLMVAIASLNSMWSTWFTTDFGFTAIMLGLVATGIGIAELTGSLNVSLFFDHIGRYRSCTASIILFIVSFALLPFISESPTTAIAMLIVTVLCGELALVSLLPVYATQLPEARGTVLSLAFLGGNLGAAMGVPLALTMLTHYGVAGVSVVAITSLMLLLIILQVFLKA